MAVHVPAQRNLHLHHILAQVVLLPLCMYHEKKRTSGFPQIHLNQTEEGETYEVRLLRRGYRAAGLVKVLPGEVLVHTRHEYLTHGRRGAINPAHRAQ